VATREVYDLIFGAVVLVIVSVAVLLVALQRLKRRKAQLLSELKSSPRLNSDRAFNRLEMARRESEILARQGTDISRARELIAQSQAALDLRQFERSYELAQSAHESLVAARQGRSPLLSAPSSNDAMSPRAGFRPPPATGSSSPASVSPSAVGPLPASTGVPRNRIESQFEMRLLDSDLETARKLRPSDPGTLAGIDFQAKAQVAFTAGEYTDALKFTLKGRRGIGGHVESVAPSPTSKSMNTGTGPVDPALAAESAASGERCPNCGYPTTSADVFCRGCGAPRTPTTCSRCGTPRTPSDTFCGRCGERFS
jgi:hypothetical protein